MNQRGIRLELLAGPNVPVPLPLTLTEALQRAQVKFGEDNSGFELTFKIGKTYSGMPDFQQINNPQLKPFSRVIIIVRFNAIPYVLMDGIIMNQQLSHEGDGSEILTVIGEDVSIMMDLEEKSTEHPGQPDNVIATRIIASYFKYGLVPTVIPPSSIDTPSPLDRVPSQQCTDLEYLVQMAKKYGYVFFIIPGPVPMSNIAYWGPPRLLEIPQRALSVNLGPETNVKSINFRNDSLVPVDISGSIQDSSTNNVIPVMAGVSTRRQLSLYPADTNNSFKRKKRFRALSGMNVTQANALAQGMKDAAGDVIIAEGEIDALKYNGLLMARGIVGVRGAGFMNDGLYYVKRVTHNISLGEYTQSFTLSREGVGALSPEVFS